MCMLCFLHELFLFISWLHYPVRHPKFITLMMPINMHSDPNQLHALLSRETNDHDSDENSEDFSQCKRVNA